MSGLPDEIIENILSWLPVKSISRFRCVSKYWCYNLFQNPNFIKLHLKHAIQINNYNLLVSNYGAIDNVPAETYLYSIDHNVLSSLPSASSEFLGQAVEIDYPFMHCCAPHILGSCHGLICMQPYPGAAICIWNPCTKEYKQVPATPIQYPSDAAAEQGHLKAACGFGYDCKLEDYKFVRIVYFEPEEDVSEARVYTVGSNKWRALGLIPYNFSIGENSAYGYLLNGVLYWIVSVYRTGNKSPGVIVSFDICNETFRDMPLPNNYSSEDPSVSQLGVLEGKLCMLRRIRRRHKDHVDVWTMNNNTWSKHLSIRTQLKGFYFGRPIQTSQNGEILFESGLYKGKGEGVGLISYDPKLERARVLKIHGFPDDFELVACIETLVSLNSGTYVGKNKREKTQMVT